MNPSRSNSVAAALLALALAAPACKTSTARKLNVALNNLSGGNWSAGGASTGDARLDLAVAAANWTSVAVAQYQAQRTHSAEDEAKAIGWQKSQGTVLKIRRAAVSPTTATPGKAIEFEMDYALVGSEKELPVSEDWEILRDGKKLTGTAPRTEKRQAGGWRAHASIDLPEGAKGGKYVVRSHVRSGKLADTRDARFTVVAAAEPESTQATDAQKPPKPAEAAAGPVDRDLMQVQGRLKELGHDPGPIDGRMRVSTQAALKAFQGEYGLPATGRPDPETRKALGLGAKDAAP